MIHQGIRLTRCVPLDVDPSTPSGEFPSVMARVVRKQDHDRPLVEVAADQALFQFDNESGVLVGECWAQGREGRGAYAMRKEGRQGCSKEG